MEIDDHTLISRCAGNSVTRSNTVISPYSRIKLQMKALVSRVSLVTR